MKKYKVDQPINWHKGVWDMVPNPVGFVVDMVFSGMEKNNFGFGRSFYITIYKNNLVYLGYDIDNLREVGEKIAESWEQNSRKYKSAGKKIQNAGNDLEEYGKVIKNYNLKNVSNKKLWNIYRQLLRHFCHAVSWHTVTEPLTAYIQPKIDDFLKKIKPRDRQIITTPSWTSFLQKQKIEENKITKKY